MKQVIAIGNALVVFGRNPEDYAVAPLQWFV
jgi:hypothetical protein